MATDDDCLQIDIWSNRDAGDIVNLLCRDLKRIFSYPINRHDTSTLADSTGYNVTNGTVVVVVTAETIRMLATTPSLNFSNLQTVKPNRYYVDNEDLLADHNTRVKVIGGDVLWIRAHLECDDPQSLQSIFRQIVHSTVTGADAGNGVRRQGNKFTATVNKRKGKNPSKRGKRGAFTVIPNEFQIGMIKKDKGRNSADGTLIIETSDVPWDFRGDPLTGYLVNIGDKDSSVRVDIEITKLSPARVYSFKLPENVEPATYMMHLRDGGLITDHELGNRRITVYSSVSYISENLFAENHLAALCDVTNLSTKQNCEQADIQLCGYYERTQLPLMLPRQLGKTFPTLLHLACYYGMENLFKSIIDSFCSLSSLNIANESLKKPGDLAMERGHTLLAEILSNQLTIQDMYVGQYSQYVSHDPVGSPYYGDFYDTYCTVSFDSENGYVTGVKTVHENYEDGDYIYTVAPAHEPAHHPATRSKSVTIPNMSPPQVQAQQSRTLPRALHTELLFQRDIPPDALVSDDMNDNFPRELNEISQLVANSEINVTLAEKHIRDWTKRMNSLKRHDQLDKRLEYQIELRKDMSEKYVPVDRRYDTYKELITPASQPPLQAPPVIPPRKPSIGVGPPPPASKRPPPTASKPSQGRKKLPALPPDAPTAPTSTSPPPLASRQNGPVAPPRTLNDAVTQRTQLASADEDEYMEPSRDDVPPPLTPRWN